MGKKILIKIISIQLIGSKILKSFYLAIKCQSTKKVFKSPIIYGQNSGIHQSGENPFWTVQLNYSQKKINCKMISLDQNQQITQMLSQAQLDKQFYHPQKNQEQKQLYFYNRSKKIANLIYSIQVQKPIKFNPTKQPLQTEETKVKMQKNKYFSQQKSINPQQLRMMGSFDEQNQRYKVQLTPYQTMNNTAVHIKVQTNDLDEQLFERFDESSIQERHPYTVDNSMILNEDNSNQKDNQETCLKKWLKKISKIQKEEQIQDNSLQFQCKIPEKFKQHKQNTTAHLCISSVKLHPQIQENFILDTISLSILDGSLSTSEKAQSSLFQCSFSLLSKQPQNKDNKNKIIKQLKLKNLLVQIPENQNIQISFFLADPQNNQDKIKIQGILIKDKFFSEDTIPLFTEDEEIFATLSYKAKRIQNVSVQSLPELEELAYQNPNQTQNYDQLQLDNNLSTYQNKQSNIKRVSPIKQRKYNLALRKKQTLQKGLQRKSSRINDQLKIKIEEDEEQKDTIQNFINQSRISVSQKNSPIHNFLQRSNTEHLPHFQLQEQDDQNSQFSVSRNQSKFRHDILKINSNIARYTVDLSLSQSPALTQNPTKLKRQNINLRSTKNKNDQSDEQEQQYFQGDTFKVFDNQSNSLYIKSKPHSPIKDRTYKRKMTQVDEDLIRTQQTSIIPKNIQNGFVIQINSVTVILYERPKPEEQQSGKFLILKSDQQETFITQTLFHNHLNLNWKNKHFRFSSSEIQISMYERTGNSSQSQNKLMGKVLLKFVDLIKAIKNNFFRAQMLHKSKNIGTLIILYDIFMEKYPTIPQRRKNLSQMKMDYRVDKISRSINKNQQKTMFRRQQDKSTQKTIQYKPKTRKRAKTLQSSLKLSFLPPIKLSKSPTRTKKNYQGGKNIKIGRAQRFSCSNMAEMLGQL